MISKTLLRYAIFSLGIYVSGCERGDITEESAKKVEGEPTPSTVSPGSTSTPSTTTPGTTTKPSTTTVENAFNPNNECFKCHTSSTVLGKMMSFAKAGWENSVHAKGIFDGEEYGGTDAFYANGGGCQVCHTGEGFLKKQNGEYADAAAIAADVITSPSSINCFTCHAPHDRKNFSLTVANGTEVTLASGTKYKKTRGSLCASCHMVRMPAGKTANQDIISVIQTSGFSSQRTSVHYGPQTDLLMGTPGATYAGKTYSNSAHTTADAADCLTCHKSFPSSRASLSPNVGGHSFNVVGKVHEADTANAAGCIGCHTKAKAALVSAAQSDSAKYLPENKAYVNIDGLVEKTKISEGLSTGLTHKKNFATVLKALANPIGDPNDIGDLDHESRCQGLLQEALVKLNGGTGYDITKGFIWSKDGKCKPENLAKTKTKVVDATDTTPDVRVFKALYNWNYANTGDRSFGVHNYKLAMQLLHDSCMDLKDYTGNTTADCGTRP